MKIYSTFFLFSAILFCTCTSNCKNRQNKHLDIEIESNQKENDNRISLQECPNRINGCLFKGDIHLHEKNCRFIKCGIRGCPETGTKTNISKHKPNCLFGQTQCTLCNKLINVSDFKEHLENECLERLVRCLKCKNTYLFSYLENHQKYSCVFRNITCKYCNKNIQFNSQKKHNQNECIGHKECPHCKIKFPKKKIKGGSIDILSHEKICKEKLINCTNVGCSKIIARKNLNQHLKICIYKIVACPNNYCRKKIIKQDLKNHDEICKKMCTHCVQKIHFNKRNHHFDKCPDKMVRCPKCLKLYKSKCLEQHKNDDCAHRMLKKCKNYGCNYTYVISSQVGIANYRKHRKKDCNGQKVKKCPNCSHYTLKTKINQHLESQCKDHCINDYEYILFPKPFHRWSSDDDNNCSS